MAPALLTDRTTEVTSMAMEMATTVNPTGAMGTTAAFMAKKAVADSTITKAAV
jgi:hypothetical protein